MCQRAVKVDPAMVCWMRWEVRFHGYQMAPVWYCTCELTLKQTCSVSPDETNKGSMVEDFVAVVHGGSSESITALVSKKLPTPQLMRLWGDGVRFNPDFIRKTVSCRSLTFGLFPLSSECDILTVIICLFVFLWHLHPIWCWYLICFQGMKPHQFL